MGTLHDGTLLDVLTNFYEGIKVSKTDRHFLPYSSFLMVHIRNDIRAEDVLQMPVTFDYMWFSRIRAPSDEALEKVGICR